MQISQEHHIDNSQVYIRLWCWDLVLWKLLYIRLWCWDLVLLRTSVHQALLWKPCTFENFCTSSFGVESIYFWKLLYIRLWCWILVLLKISVHQALVLNPCTFENFCTSSFGVESIYFWKRLYIRLWCWILVLWKISVHQALVLNLCTFENVCTSGFVVHTFDDFPEQNLWKNDANVMQTWCRFDADLMQISNLHLICITMMQIRCRLDADLKSASNLHQICITFSSTFCWKIYWKRSGCMFSRHVFQADAFGNLKYNSSTYQKASLKYISSTPETQVSQVHLK